MTEPTAFNTIDEARSFAWAKSVFSDFFFYVIHSTSGRYIVDTLGQTYSDEKMIEVYYKGEIEKI